MSWKPTNAGRYYLRVYANDDGIITSGDYINAKTGNRHAVSTTTVTVYVNAGVNVAASPDAGGSAVISTGEITDSTTTTTATIGPNTSAYIKATANDGYSFSGWSASTGISLTSTTANPTTVKLNNNTNITNSTTAANKRITASFTENLSTLSVEKSGGTDGRTVSSSKSKVGVTTASTVNASAPSGYGISGVTVSGNVAFTYNGTTYGDGDTMDLSSSPLSSLELSVKGDGTDGGSGTVTVSFVASTKDVTVYKTVKDVTDGAYAEGSAAPAGTVTIKQGDTTKTTIGTSATQDTGAIANGSTVNVVAEAVAAQGYEFVGWYDHDTGNELSTSATYQLSNAISASMTVDARFDRKHTVTIKQKLGSADATVVQTLTGYYLDDEYANVTANIPDNTGYDFNASTSVNYTEAALNAHDYVTKEVTLQFDIKTYNVTVSALGMDNTTDGYAVSLAAPTANQGSLSGVGYGTAITFSKAVADGYSFAGWYLVKDTSAGAADAQPATATVNGTGDTKEVTVNDLDGNNNYHIYALYKKNYSYSAFASYEAVLVNDEIDHFTLIAKAPTKIAVNGGTAASYEPVSGSHSTGSAGDKIVFTYSSLASSVKIDKVYVDNTPGINYTSSAPVIEQYSDTRTLLTEGTDYTVDQSNHTVTFTLNKDYKNMTIDLGSKYRIVYSDTDAVTLGGSYNTDLYYYGGEPLASAGFTLTKKANSTAVGGCSYTLGTPVIYEYDDETGKPTETVVSGLTATKSGSVVTIKGTMPDKSVYIDLGVTTSYTAGLRNKILEDPVDKQSAFSASYNGTVSITYNGSTASGTGTKTVNKGESVTYSFTAGTKKDNYMFLGWYEGNASNPEAAKLISTKTSFSYTPKGNMYVWALATRVFYLRGEGTEMGDWKVDNIMKYDPVNLEFYYDLYNYTYATGDTDNMDFKIFHTTGMYSDEIWNYINDKDVTQNNGVWSGKYNGNGFFRLLKSDYDKGYGAPIRIHYRPIANSKGSEDVWVSGSMRYHNVYLSSGYWGLANAKYITKVADMPSKIDSKTLGYTKDGKTVTTTKGDVTAATSLAWGTTSGSDHESVLQYTVKQQDGVVGITTTSTASYKVAAFVVYDLGANIVYAVKGTDIYTKDSVDENGKAVVTPGGKNVSTMSANQYYIELTVSNNLYVCPVYQSTAADMTVYVNTASMSTATWGKLVSLYNWGTTAHNGAFPGQLMIPSDDGKSFYLTVPASGMTGITFANYYSGTFMTGNTVSNAIGDYNTGKKSVQTYDYREPVAMYANVDTANGEEAILSFGLEEGQYNAKAQNVEYYTKAANSTIPASAKSNAKYLTSADGKYYVDLNGMNISGKPTNTYYIMCRADSIYDKSKLYKGTYDTNKLNGGVLSGYTYGGADGVEAHYGVEWYIYDASGNYITHTMSAGFADKGTVWNDTVKQSYVSSLLESLGYPVDGCSVKISYDTSKAYGSVTRYSGQWYKSDNTDDITINVRVGMYSTENGYEVTATNAAGYGSATAAYTGAKSQDSYTVGPNGDFVTIKKSDAHNSPVKLSATDDNFLGWYYLGDDGEFHQTSTRADNYYPALNTDFTYYAIYDAKATYNYVYLDRNGNEAVYSKVVELNSTEMENNFIPEVDKSRLTDNLPANINVFKQTLSMDIANATITTVTSKEAFDAADPAAISNPVAYTTSYSLYIKFPQSKTRYTVTCHYKDASGADKLAKIQGVYNDVCALDTGLVPVSYKSGNTTMYFKGWYTAASGGRLLSVSRRYGLSVTNNATVYAQYATADDMTAFRAADTWGANIDEIIKSRMITTNEDTAINDFIVSYINNNGTMAKDTAYTYGIILISSADGTGTTNNAATAETYVKKMIDAYGAVTKAVRMKGTELVASNYVASSLSEMNRIDFQVKGSADQLTDSTYTAYAYVYDTANKQVIAISETGSSGTYL